ncbi:hypothetical protein BD309DRAFT_961066 [Dichomitus squalens]|nr:hypothetical protein BD309DRAFT_961066 [Dichomitus squalens]
MPLGSHSWIYNPAVVLAVHAMGVSADFERSSTRECSHLVRALVSTLASAAHRSGFEYLRGSSGYAGGMRPS